MNFLYQRCISTACRSSTVQPVEFPMSETVSLSEAQSLLCAGEIPLRSPRLTDSRLGHLERTQELHAAFVSVLDQPRMMKVSNPEQNIVMRLRLRRIFSSSRVCAMLRLTLTRKRLCIKHIVFTTFLFMFKVSLISFSHSRYNNYKHSAASLYSLY